MRACKVHGNDLISDEYLKIYANFHMLLADLLHRQIQAAGFFIYAEIKFAEVDGKVSPQAW